MNSVRSFLGVRQKRPVSTISYVAFGLAVVILIVFPAFSSRFLLSNMVLFFLFVPMSLGLCLLWGRCGVLSFGQVAFFGIAGYIYGIVTINLGDAAGATWLGLLAGLAVAAMMAALFGYFVFYGQVSGWILPVLTLALTLILELFFGQTAGYQWRVGKALLGGFNGINNIESLKLGPVDFDGGTKSLYYLVVLGSVILFLLLRGLVNSRWGTVITAIREDIDRTRLLGHNVNLIQVVIFVIAAELAALSGLMYVWWGNYIDPSAMGLISATLPVVFTAVGGKEGLLSVMISTVFLGYLGDFLSVYGGQFAFLVNGALLVFVIMFFPRGIVLSVGERIESWLLGRTTGPERDASPSVGPADSVAPEVRRPGRRRGDSRTDTRARSRRDAADASNYRALEGVRRNQGGGRRVPGPSQGRASVSHRSQWRGQVDVVQPRHGPLSPERRLGRAGRRRHHVAAVVSSRQTRRQHEVPDHARLQRPLRRGEPRDSTPRRQRSPRRGPGALGAGDVRSRAARGPARRFADPRGKAVARDLSGVGDQSSAFSCWTSRRWA